MKPTTITIVAALAVTSLALPACTKDRSEASLALPACTKDWSEAPASEHSQHAAAVNDREQIVELSVTSDGFVPASFKVRAGHPVKLVVTRKVERTCATDIVIKDLKISAPLPLDKAVEFTFTPTKPGKIRFACAMNHITGEIVVE